MDSRMTNSATRTLTVLCTVKVIGRNGLSATKLVMVVQHTVHSQFPRTLHMVVITVSMPMVTHNPRNAEPRRALLTVKGAGTPGAIVPRLVVLLAAKPVHSPFHARLRTVDVFAVFLTVSF